MNHYKGINNRTIFYSIIINILIIFLFFFTGCSQQKKNIKKNITLSAFAGLQNILLIDCESIPSNINAGIFSASDQDKDMISMALGIAFRKVPHIRLTQIPFSKGKFQKKLSPQLNEYDALISAKLWWQLNAENSIESPKYLFDLMLQLKLYRKDENNTIQTRNFYFSVISSEGMILKNHLFFCEKDNIQTDSFLQRIIIPAVSKNILKLTNVNLSKSDQSNAPFLDNKSKILFEEKAYYALIQYIVESRLAKNNTDIIPLFLDAQISEAIKVMAEKNNYFRNSNSHPLYAKKHHKDLYILGLCLEKTGRIKKALEYYRFIIKNFPEKSKLSAKGIGRCLKKMEIRDHIQWARVNTQADAAFKLAAIKQITIKPVNKPQEQKNIIKKEQEPVIIVDDNSSYTSNQEVASNDYTSAKPETNFDDETIAIQIMIDEWLSAWQSKNIDDYLRYYASDFQPENNLSIESWKDKRKKRLNLKSIFVSIVGEANINFNSDIEAIVTFVQDFESKGYYYKDRTKKRLVLKKINDNWKIYKEQILDIIN